jgi:hypothetical protein
LIPPPFDLASYELMIEKGYRLKNVGDEHETVLEETSLSKYDPFQNFASGRIPEMCLRAAPYLGSDAFQMAILVTIDVWTFSNSFPCLLLTYFVYFV